MASWWKRLVAPGPPPREPPGVVRQVALLALAAALGGFTILRGIAPHDEGLMLEAGARIAHGQLPYRDFWTNYPPGQWLLVAGLFKLFGPSLLSWRVVRVALDAAVTLLAYRLARREAPERFALAAAVAAAGAMAFPLGAGPNPAALALALGAVLAASRAPVWAGLLAGVAILFRIEFGLAAAAGVALAAPPGRRARGTLAGLGVGALTLAPFFLISPHDMASDTIGFLSRQDLQRLPFPLGFDGALRPSKLIEFYIPLILLVGLGAWALAAALGLRQDRRGSHRPGGLALAPLALVGAAYLLGRTDEFHLLPLAAVLPVMLAAVAAGEVSMALRVVLLTLLALIAIHGLERQAGQALHPPTLARVPGPAGDGVETSPPDAAALAALRRDVDRLVAPGQPVFVADPRHDLVRVGDPLLYVILDRANPTRYDVMQPGVVTTEAVQREIVRELERSRTRVVVRWLNPTASRPEPNGAGRSSGVHVLDRYLAGTYRPQARFGYYAVLVRR